jgi:hypothetical protein
MATQPTQAKTAGRLGRELRERFCRWTQLNLASATGLSDRSVGSFERSERIGHKGWILIVDALEARVKEVVKDSDQLNEALAMCRELRALELTVYPPSPPRPAPPPARSPNRRMIPIAAVLVTMSLAAWLVWFWFFNVGWIRHPRPDACVTPGTLEVRWWGARKVVQIYEDVRACREEGGLPSQARCCFPASACENGRAVASPARLHVHVVGRPEIKLWDEGTERQSAFSFDVKETCP